MTNLTRVNVEQKTPKTVAVKIIYNKCKSLNGNKMKYRFDIH